MSSREGGDGAVTGKSLRLREIEGRRKDGWALAGLDTHQYVLHVNTFCTSII